LIQIKYKNCEKQLVKNLEEDLLEVKQSILGHSPSDFNRGKLDRIRIRIFKFPKKETCNEFFIVKGNKKYVCLNSSLLKKRYYFAKDCRQNLKQKQNKICKNKKPIYSREKQN